MIIPCSTSIDQASQQCVSRKFLVNQIEEMVRFYSLEEKMELFYSQHWV